MNRAVRILIGAALVVSFAGTGMTYTRPRFQVGPDVKQSRWPTSSTIPIVVNTNAMNFIAGSQPFLAVRNMFELRSAYTPLRFSFTSATSPDSIGFDGTSLVTFADTAANQSAVGSFAAVTWFWWDLIDGEPVLVESDIVFSSAFDFTTTGFGDIDIENLGGHELIHFQSFDHSGVMASTAFPNFYTSEPNEHNLNLDDIAAANFLHPFPDTAARTGSLSGVVEKPGDVPVFGAHVVAQRRTDGVPVSDISVFGGAWRIDGLPPSQYKVFVEPLDGPATPGNTLFSGIYTESTVDDAFETTFYGGNASPTNFLVSAGSETSAGTIVLPATAGPLNLLRLGLSPVQSLAAFASAINVEQGWLAYLTVNGPGVDQVPDDGLSVSGSGVNLSSSGVVRGTFAGDPFMIVELTVDADAMPGTRTIFADDGTYMAALTGGIEVHPSNPFPNLLRNDELTSVAPITPALPGLLPLDATGPDGFLGTGEGVLREFHGSDDDDDLYVPEIWSGFRDPDTDVLTDGTRPLVLYQLDDSNRILYLDKDAGRLVVTYEDGP